jgi:alkyl sulfatase BDS1-like metallo-beta-lactamase superfamily hydrolase
MDVRLPFTALLLGTWIAAAPVMAQQSPFGGVQNPLRAGEDQKEADRINEAISIAYGFGNTFMVTTSEGNVIIDTSSVFRAPAAKKLLQAVSTAPIKYIILTHGHGDHTGGVPLWKEAGTEIIGQREEVEFLNYQTRLARFFAIRNSAQFGFPTPPPTPWAGDFGAQILATKLFDDEYKFTLGGLEFQIFSTPGETPDHLTVWLPKYKAAFVGDNYYASFPNMYTLRGTKPRWALDYIASLNKVMALKPEIVLPSHGRPIRGNAEITRRLTQYRDAIQYVHDAVVKGMNDGKDEFTLMREIKLPPELVVGESYGNLIWTIRGIYEGYAGWFDMNPATIYETPISSVSPDLVKLAGGTDALAQAAQKKAEAGQLVEALHLTQIALDVEPTHRHSLEVRLAALQKLREQSKNSNEAGWLDYSIRQTREKVAASSK